MNRYVRHICLVVLAHLLSPYIAVAQVVGVTRLADDKSAIEYLFQPTIPWSGSKYSPINSEVGKNFYINLSGGVAQPWRYGDELYNEDWGFTSRLSLEYRVAPVHALDAGVSWNRMVSGDDYLSASLFYLFNISTYASRSELPTRWEVRFLLGMDVDLNSTYTTSVVTGARFQYNISASVGLFVEPRVSTVCYVGENSLFKGGDVTSSLSLGLSLNPSNMREAAQQAAQRRRAYWASTRYRLVPIMEVKTNLLFDAATLLNVEVEVPIGRWVSLSGEWTFPWWCNDDGTVYSKRNRTQLLNGTVEAKYWLGDRYKKSAMTGWSVGIFSSGGLYDFERNAEGYQGEFFVAAGVSAGYAHSINMSETLRMEYTLGVGYLQTDYSYYKAYYDTDEYRWRPIIQETGRYSVLTPLRLKVSLGWLITKRKKY